jgi:hypothetical protein
MSTNATQDFANPAFTILVGSRPGQPLDWEFFARAATSEAKDRCPQDRMRTVVARAQWNKTTREITGTVVKVGGCAYYPSTQKTNQTH